MTLAMAILAGAIVGSGDSTAVPSFSRDISPILARRCFVCHGPDVSTRRAKLRLDEREGATALRRSGTPAIEPGNLDGSELWLRITDPDPDIRMPPADEGHDALSEEEVGLIRRWIESGAPYGTHWSWEPIRAYPVPSDRIQSWPKSDIDHFILASLTERSLEPAPDADPASRLRRLHFDLVGLPPSPKRVQAFLADPSDEAWMAEVDRLLADPGFGETWGRHWLDLMRYAETYGHEFDYPIAEAWRYRDWVIAALNVDMPYDQFVREQIHGDLMDQVRGGEQPGLPPPIVATGWWWMSQDKHAPVDVRAEEADRIDNQVDVFGRAFLGTTLACARCHDHKFDSITQDHYYSMAGIIQSSRRVYAYLDPGGQLDQAADSLLDRLAEVLAVTPSESPEQEPLRVSDAIFSWDFGLLDDNWDAWSKDGWAFDDAHRPSGSVIATDGIGIRRVLSGQVCSATAATALQGNARSPDFKIDASHIYFRALGTGSRIRLHIDGYFLDEHNPLLFEGLILNLDDEETWRTYEMDVSRFGGERSYIELVDDGDGFLSVDWIVHSDGLDGSLKEEQVRGTLDDEDSPELARLAEVGASISEPERALAIAEGSPGDRHLLIRGDHRNESHLSPRSLMTAFPGGDESAVSGSGRVQLADQLLAPKNPLTSRVFVNRVWHHLVGRGLSPTTDDLGGMGLPPSHPELLDTLAHRFRDRWSLKGLVRKIVLSRAYSMTSRSDDRLVAERDPDGRFLSSAHCRPLSAEKIRDAMLAVSGTLDRERGGEPVPVHLSESMQGRGRPAESGPIDGENRRSIYLAVRRNFLLPMFLAFDFPVPATTVGVRSRSNLPAQGLILLNAPFVVGQAYRFGERGAKIAADGGSVEAALGEMVLLAWSRPASAEEMLVLVEALGQGRQEDWTDVAHAMLASKEFLYLR